ncbi:MAG: hydrolase [Candidatus Altiarchaeota archaeon]
MSEKKCEEVCCCPRLKSDDWDKKTFEWKNKPFYKTKYLSFFRIPLTYRGAVKKSLEVLKAKGLVRDPMLMLAEEESMFYSTLLVEMSGDDENLPVRRLSGTYVSMFFEGGYRDTPRWIREMVDYCTIQGERPKELYFFYATCPKCAKYYGSAQTVLFARIK